MISRIREMFNPCLCVTSITILIAGQFSSSLLIIVLRDFPPHIFHKCKSQNANDLLAFGLPATVPPTSGGERSGGISGRSFVDFAAVLVWNFVDIGAVGAANQAIKME